jgi:hypothetical protein
VKTAENCDPDVDGRVFFGLAQVDKILSYGSLGNYSLAGFEMVLHRFVSHYIITYYLPSGKKVTFYRFARVFVVQHTKMGKNTPNDHKIYQIAIKWP